MSTLKVGTIQDHANSNTAMTLDGSGVSIKTSPSFLLKQSGATTYGSGVYNEMIKSGLFTNLHDSDSAISSAGVFTVPSGKGGIYLFNWGMAFQSIGTGNYCATVLKIDGSDDQSTERYFESGVTNFPFRCTQMIQLNAGQTVIPRSLQSTGGTLSDNGGGTRTGFFGGFKIA
tara:strand:- start:57 stop:575 length:519 start_codon:yes stop_codon:yes gene_type:complete